MGGCTYFSDSVLDEELEEELRNCLLPPPFIPQRKSVAKNEPHLEEYYVYDPVNGFLHVFTGPVPTCGCSYSTTAAAYGKSDGTTVIISRDVSYCGQNTSISGNLPIWDILPRDEISPEQFYGPGLFPNYDHAYFYLDVEIPRQGTETKVTLKPFFINLVPPKWDHFAFSPRTEEREAWFNWDNMYLEVKINRDAMFPNIWSSPELSEHEIEFWSEGIILHESSGLAKELPADEKQAIVRHFASFYQEYRKLKYQAFILDWDKSKGKFYIKERIEAPPKTFFQFLRELPYFSPSC